jgi:hypothetical protein
MFVLIQSYLAAATDFLADVAGRGGGAGSGGGGGRGGRHRSSAIETDGNMDRMKRILDRLMVTQGIMLDELTSLGWPPPEAVRPVFQELYNHPAVIGGALQLIAAACVDMQGTFKQQQQKWRQQKAALKAAAAAAAAAAARDGKKKRGEGGATAAAPLSDHSPLLKLTIPADHADAGVPAGWEQGLEPWRREDEDGVPEADWTLAARLCHQAEVLLRNHYRKLLQAGRWDHQTVIAIEKETDELLSVHVAKLPVMKLLLEAVFCCKQRRRNLGYMWMWGGCCIWQCETPRPRLRSC